MTTTTLSESQAVGMAEQGGAGANCTSGVSERLTAIWQEERNRLIGRAYLLVRNKDLAEDLASETLVRCLEHLPEHEASLRGYLHTTCRNLALSGLMAMKKLASPEWYERLALDDEALNQVFIRQCIDQLAIEPELHKLIVAVLAHDGDMKAVAAELGLTGGALRMAFSRARKALGITKLGRNFPRPCATGITGSAFICRTGSLDSLYAIASIPVGMLQINSGEPGSEEPLPESY